MAWRRLALPRALHDRSGFLLLQCGLPLILWFEFTRVLPVLFEEYPEYVVPQTIFIVLLFINTEISLWLSILKDTSIQSIREKLPSILKADWKYCNVCQLNAPPRSSHCFTCNCCVVRRDHHCLFTGNCVGYFNHRAFLTFVSCYWFGSLYANILNFAFVRHVAHHFTVSTIFSVILPVPAYLLGYMEEVSFLTGTMSALSVVSFIGSSAMMYNQLVHITRGQTAYERKHKITDFSKGWRENLAELCGPRWYIALLCPLIPSPLDGDGTHFVPTLQSAAEDIKNV